MRSSFGVQFKSSETEGEKTTNGIDIGAINNYWFSQILLDAEGYRGSETVYEFQSQISWVKDEKKKRKTARNLSQFSSLMQSLCLLRICDVLFVINIFDDNWQEFEDFLDASENFNQVNKSSSPTTIIYLIKGADNLHKQNTGIRNLKYFINRGEDSGKLKQSFIVHFLPAYNGSDKEYKSKNQPILDIVDKIFKLHQVNHNYKSNFIQTIKLFTSKINSINGLRELIASPILQANEIRFNAVFPNDSSLEIIKEILKDLKVCISYKQRMKYQLKEINIYYFNIVFWEFRDASYNKNGYNLFKHQHQPKQGDFFQKCGGFFNELGFSFQIQFNQELR
ncbi:UNKNOWN [Stylonychia lemnae]|uniref:Uncharacterized protein n=1 Tax=Stylonychia lemnae TaxID=5949 RepID=A0A077ZYB4_STYLE|nr:UNKNOWN [Stylonychia lemnae]|eukprot:CDW74901.1 UNKNOWN [Stylonychia lemnae]